MRRIVTAALIAASLIIGGLAGAEPAQAHHRPGPCPVHWWAAWHEDGRIGPVRVLIRCAVARWPVDGGASKALAVARCESGFRPDAYGYGNGGVFQHRIPYWEGRLDYFTSPWWHLRPSIYNARTNVVIAIRMAHTGGWGPWSCA